MFFLKYSTYTEQIEHLLYCKRQQSPVKQNQIQRSGGLRNSAKTGSLIAGGNERLKLIVSKFALQLNLIVVGQILPHRDFGLVLAFLE